MKNNNQKFKSSYNIKDIVKNNMSKEEYAKFQDKLKKIIKK